MVLQPLEFSECLTDSPHFRDKLHVHEKELERTSKSIKGLLKECTDLLNAENQLSKAQRNFSRLLNEFEFECIGAEKTDDEILIENSFKEFGKLISIIEESRENMLKRVQDAVIAPMIKFRKEQIGEAKKGRQTYEKQTTRFYQSHDKYLAIRPTKATDNQMIDADQSWQSERHMFFKDSMTYVLKLQEVQERKKFEFVELLLQFMYSWLTFYHECYECYDDVQPYMKDLSSKLQKCRANFSTTRDEAEMLMRKMLEAQMSNKPTAEHQKQCTREGYLFMLEKKALTNTWTKYYCQYSKEQKLLSLLPFNQLSNNKITNPSSRESYTLTSCVRKASESIDKRFCFDVTLHEKQGAVTLQAACEEDRKLWMEAMDGREPIYDEPPGVTQLSKSLLDDIGFSFIKKCIQAVEAKGLEDEGLYRVVGVNSKVTKLTSLLLDRRKADKVDLLGESEVELKTITSALKNYFRGLPEPLMTFKLHEAFIKAAKQESKTLRINDIHELVHRLPESNFEMMDTLVAHLKRVSDFSAKNLMNVSNIGVCFGPTLMRPREETMAAIIDIKFCNLVVEILIENYEKVFKTRPEFADLSNSRVLDSRPVNKTLLTPDFDFTPNFSPNNTLTPLHTTTTTPQRPPPNVPIMKPKSTTTTSTATTTTTIPHNHPPTHPPAFDTEANATHNSTPSTHLHYYDTNKTQYSHFALNTNNNNNNNNPNNNNTKNNNTTTTIFNIKPSTKPPQPTTSTTTTITRPSTTLSTNHPSTTTTNPPFPTSRAVSYHHKPPPHAGDSPINHRTTTPHKYTTNMDKYLGADVHSSASSSNESLNLRSSNSSSQSNFTNLQLLAKRHSGSNNHNNNNINTNNNNNIINNNNNNYSSNSSSSIFTNVNSSPLSTSARSTYGASSRTARTLYSCTAENDSELSFEPNQFIENVRHSNEPGWLEGTLNGQKGLVPANYVEFIN